MDELGISLLQFDIAEYGENDMNPKRSVNTEAPIIEELATQYKCTLIRINIFVQRAFNSYGQNLADALV
ncbi:hypothetical protein Tco_0472500 [Tanacetum coccineum]